MVAITFPFSNYLVAQNQHMDSAMAAQKDLVDIFLKITGWETTKENRGKNKLIFSIIPLASTANGGKQVVVSSINAAFYAGPPATTKISNIYFIPYTNFSSRSGFIITPNIWFSGSHWNANGELRIAKNGVETYGLGTNTLKENLDEVDYQYIRVYLNLNRRIFGNFYLGAGYNLDYFYNVKDNWPHSGSSPFSNYGIGTGSQTTSTGLTFNVLIDSRKNSINASDGFYSLLVLRANPVQLNNDYAWSSIYFDNRKYIPLSSSWRSILAIWGIYWGTFGDVPYLNLPGSRLDLGGRTARGYSLMRYCGKQMLYGE
ncbi:MAG TPA: hypothetical protein VFV08_08175, partial [Puia sp.]|nr:hypothetical protein [Puia sp.]